MDIDEVMEAIRGLSALTSKDFEKLEREVRAFLIANGWENQIKSEKKLDSFQMVKFLMVQQYRQQITIHNQGVTIAERDALIRELQGQVKYFKGLSGVEE